MNIYELTGIVKQRVVRRYAALDEKAARIGDGELLSESVIDEMDFEVEEAKLEEQEPA